MAAKTGRMIALVALAYWPVWLWYARRLQDSPDEMWCLAALAVALACGPRKPDASRVWPLLLVYAVTYPWTLPIFRAALAVLTIGLIDGPASPGRIGLL